MIHYTRILSCYCAESLYPLRNVRCCETSPSLDPNQPEDDKERATPLPKTNNNKKGHLNKKNKKAAPHTFDKNARLLHFYSPEKKKNCRRS
jgi:hypothetical protein